MTSRAEARKFIDRLRVEKGGLTTDDRNFLQETRPWILDSYDSIRKTLGASTKTLATNLYSKDTRFVYEIIQNAEDNRYLRACSIKEPPWLSFTLTHEKIVIDSNEDGFTEANIKAICSIGESTKSYISGYIGEKGIGFKSVFKVASKVHVQSGDYSFSFQYQRNDPHDNGLGMVTPFNEDHLLIPPGTYTRMILYLLDDVDRVALYKDFAKLPDTLLIFLKKLRRLKIDLALPEHPKTCFEYEISSKGNRVNITTTKNSSTSIHAFLTTRKQVSHMPKDVARGGVSDAEVILAFPLSTNGAPVIEDQYTFAFLPLRKLGFKFLIQSDFITQASREDVFDNAWNRRLLDEVADAFDSSINIFLKDPTLKYHWVRYLPVGHVVDEFWKRLRDRILRSISARHVFFHRGHSFGNQLYPASRLKIVSDEYRDEIGEPLLRDRASVPTSYIAEEYDRVHDIPFVRQVGATSFTSDDFRVRLEHDLQDIFSSSMKTKPLDGPWHKKVAAVIRDAIREPHNLPKFKGLPLIPLQNGKWASASGTSIFLPASGGVEIPVDLPLGLVHPSALTSIIQQTLYNCLGISECAPSRIIPLIGQRYTGLGSLNIQDCLNHVKFLFWHNHASKINQVPEFPLVTSKLTFMKIGRDSAGWTYSPRAKGENALCRVFDLSIPKAIEDSVFLVHAQYYDHLKTVERRNGKTGSEWLDAHWHIKHETQLKHKNRDELSPEFCYICDFLPERLLGVLKTNWNEYELVASSKNRIMSTRVPILDSEVCVSLKNTYLPSPKLKTIVSRLGLHENFGFLKEIDGITEAQSLLWRFLDRFGVGCEEDLNFWKQLLRKARLEVEGDPKIVFEIYANLQRFMGPDDLENFKKSLIDITDGRPIFIPEIKTWVGIADCVWEAPAFFHFKHVVSKYERYEQLYTLFINGLGVPKIAGLQHFLEALKQIQSSSQSDERSLASISALYKEIRTVANGLKSDEVDTIREQFETQMLVYHPISKSWHPPSACIWAEDAIQLPLKQSIATEYKGMKGFFTTILRIREPNLEDHISALIAKADKNPRKQDILHEMQNICALNPNQQTIRKLLDCKCFPVRMLDGNTMWATHKDEFAIVDRVDLEQHFEGQIKMLDFCLEEVHDIGLFLHAFGMRNRYLSHLVTQETMVVQDDAVKNERLTERMRIRSFAIARYAIHSKARKDSIPYMLEVLQSSEVYTSNSIQNIISITQDGRAATASANAYVHVTIENMCLKIFIPKRNRDRDTCLAHALPEALLRHFGAEDFTHLALLGQALTMPNLSTVKKMLQLSGIIDDARIVAPEGDDEEVEEDSNDDEEQGTQSHQVTIVSETRVGSAYSRMVSITRPQSIEAPNLYKEFIGIVIAQAEAMNSIPANTCNAYSTLSSHFLSTSALTAVGSDTPMQREFNIGAAGELFVFECLSGLNLPGFNRNNWQSSIRHRVGVHEKYQDIPSWPGPETSDIVYEDQQSTMTNLLIRGGYLDATIWQGRSPTYYIEVKATMYRLDTTFYVSGRQYDRMEQMKLPDHAASENIYLIARVFGMSDLRVGMQLFVDPATLRRNNVLMFRTEKYEVTAIG